MGPGGNLWLPVTELLAFLLQAHHAPGTVAMEQFTSVLQKGVDISVIHLDNTEIR